MIIPTTAGRQTAGTTATRRETHVARGSDTRFTDRQRQVVELIAAGCSNDEIGRRLGISPRTAKAHCDVLRQKLSVRKRRQIPAAYRLLTGEDPLLPDTILRGEVMRRRLEHEELDDIREPKLPLRNR
jgi:DNA-binding CsgD family transcriptional regulator